MFSKGLEERIEKLKDQVNAEKKECISLKQQGLIDKAKEMLSSMKKSQASLDILLEELKQQNQLEQETNHFTDLNEHNNLENNSTNNKMDEEDNVEEIPEEGNVEVDEVRNFKITFI
jgi:hypothetical protein